MNTEKNDTVSRQEFNKAFSKAVAKYKDDIEASLKDFSGQKEKDAVIAARLKTAKCVMDTFSAEKTMSAFNLCLALNDAAANNFGCSQVAHHIIKHIPALKAVEHQVSK